MYNGRLMENATLRQINVPVDMNAAAITGKRVKMDVSESCAVVLSMGASTSAEVVFTLKQHNAASSGTTKDLSVMNPYFIQLSAVTTAAFTKVSPTVAAAAYDLSSTFADASGIVVFEVNGSDLDLANDFAWFSVIAADATAAKILGGLYVLNNPVHKPAYLEVV
jgi:hypothetical protein